MSYNVTLGPAVGSLGGGSIGGVTAAKMSSAPTPAPTVAAAGKLTSHWYDGLISPEVIVAIATYGPTVGVASLAIWGVKKMFFSGGTRF